MEWLKKLTLKKVVVMILLVTLYSNIGWIVGSYYGHNVLPVKHENLTTFGKVMAGGWAWLSEPDKNHGVFFGAVLPGIVWPLMIISTAVTWVVYFLCYGGYYAGYGIYHALYYAVWFILGGGGAKLLGLV